MRRLKRVVLLTDQPHYDLRAGDEGLLVDVVENQRGEKGCVIVCKGDVAVVLATEVDVLEDESELGLDIE